MYRCYQITKRVVLPPKYIDSKIKKHIKHLLNTYTNKDKCCKEYGYLLNIKKVISITCIEDNIFQVIFDAECLKPEIGVGSNGTVWRIYKDGIFVNIKERQKMLIPAQHLSQHSFDDSTQSFVSNTGGETIKEGDDIDVVVTNLQFNNGKFSCFGSLKE